MLGGAGWVPPRLSYPQDFAVWPVLRAIRSFELNELSASRRCGRRKRGARRWAVQALPLASSFVFPQAGPLVQQQDPLPYSSHAQFLAHLLRRLQHLVLDPTPLAASIALDDFHALLELFHADHKGP